MTLSLLCLITSLSRTGASAWILKHNLKKTFPCTRTLSFQYIWCNFCFWNRQERFPLTRHHQWFFFADLCLCNSLNTAMKGWESKDWQDGFCRIHIHFAKPIAIWVISQFARKWRMKHRSFIVMIAWYYLSSNSQSALKLEAADLLCEAK